MVNYKCLRCGYETEQKTGLKRHLRRKFKCKPLLNDISPDTVYNHYYNDSDSDYDLSEKKTNQNKPKVRQNKPKVSQNKPKKKSNKNAKYQCEFCDKLFAHKQSLYRHVKKRCKKNKELNEYKDLTELVNLLNKQLKQQSLGG